jgi:hypothetical protein
MNIIRNDRRLAAVTAILSGAELVLMASSWRLWTGYSSFPVVPLIRMSAVDSTTIRPTIDLVTGVLAAATLVMLFISLLNLFGLVAAAQSGSRGVLRSVEKIIPMIAVGAGLTAVVLNQQCLQAWHWLFLLCITQMVILKSPSAIRAIRTTIATVYIFSALSRVSGSISSGMTGLVIIQLLQLAGLKMAAQDPSIIQGLCWLFTAAELLTGCLLLSNYAHRIGAAFSVLLHLLLLLALSPVGLNHHSGVLWWNLTFVALVPVVFSEPRIAGEVASGTRRTDVPETQRTVLRDRGLLAVQLLVIGFPLSGLPGFADNWPSWQLYSTRPEVWKLYVTSDQAVKLPETLQQWVGPPELLSDWCPVRIDRWCLAETGTPLYPEDRIQLGVIDFLIQKGIVDGRFRVAIESPEPIFWWRRTHTTVTSTEQLHALRDGMVLNSTALERAE